MKKVDLKLEGNILTIKVDLTKEFRLSSSGKTTVPGKEDAKIDLNIYKKKIGT